MEISLDLFHFSKNYTSQNIIPTIVADGSSHSALIKLMIAVLKSSFDPIEFDEKEKSIFNFSAGRFDLYYSIGVHNTSKEKILMLFYFTRHSQHNYCIKIALPCKNYNAQSKAKIYQMLNRVEKLSKNL